MSNNNQLQRRASSNRPLTLQQMETALEPSQVRAARLLIDNEFADKGGKMTLEEIADELEITPRTLYNWRQIPMFAAYLNALADFESYRFAPVVLSQLHKAIKGGNNGLPSVKAIELWLKTQDRLVDRKEVHSFVEQSQVTTITREEVSEGLAGLDRFIEGR